MKKYKLPKKLRRDWLKALRSGEYNQCDGELRNKYEGSYCCIGVLCKVQKLKNEDIDSIGDLVSNQFAFENTIKFPKTLVSFNKKERTRENTEFTNTLISMNDDDGKTFDEIADYIEDKTIGV